MSDKTVPLLLRRVTAAVRRKDRALDQYRDALVAARERHTLKEIADAAGTYPQVVYTIIRRRKGESDGSPESHTET